MNIVFASEDMDEDTQALVVQVDDVVDEAGIRVLSDKSLSAMAVDNDIVLGAVFTTDDMDEFDFDVAVHPEHQGKGIGNALMNVALDELKEIAFDINPNIETAIRVLHPAVRSRLYKEGFVVDLVNGLYNCDDVIMRYAQPSNNEKLSHFEALIEKDNPEYFERVITPLLLRHNKTLDTLMQGLVSVSKNERVDEGTVQLLNHFALAHPHDAWERELLLVAIGQTHDHPVVLPADRSEQLRQLIDDSPEHAEHVAAQQLRLVGYPVEGAADLLRRTLTRLNQSYVADMSDSEVILTQNIQQQLMQGDTLQEDVTFSPELRRR